MIALNIYPKASAIVVLLAVFAAGAPAASEVAPPSVTEADANTDVNAFGTDSIWHDLSTEELEKLIAQAEQTRLAEERQKVVAELRDDLLYDDAAVDKAVVMLQKASKPTQADNIKHICEAFAIVDRRFAKPYKLYRDGKYDAAALAARQILDPKKTSNLSAAVHFLYADALGRYADSLDKDPANRKRAVGLHHDAVEACRDLLVRMPERTSFAVTAGLQAAATYERMHRYYYAMQMYLFCLTNYGLTIDPDEFERIRLKIEKWQEMYKQPLSTIASMMGDVEKRLAAADGGKDTQAKGTEVVLLLEDVIKTMEEKSGGSKSQAKGGKKGKRPECKSCGGKGCGKCGGKGNKGRQGRPSGVKQPSSPAQASVLVPGPVARPTKRSEVRPTGETGEWAKKSPRQRQQIQQLMKRGMSERSRDQVRDYLAAIAERSAEEDSGSP